MVPREGRGMGCVATRCLFEPGAFVFTQFVVYFCLSASVYLFMNGVICDRNPLSGTFS